MSIDRQILGEVSAIRDLVSDKVKDLERLEGEDLSLGKSYRYDLHSAILKLQTGVSALESIVSDLERNIEEDSEG